MRRHLLLLILLPACAALSGQTLSYTHYDTKDGLAGSVVYAPTIAVAWAMYADAADYSEWQTGRRFTGMVFATIGFSLKAGLALGSACFLLDPRVDFFTVNLDLRWRLDPELHLAGADLEHGDLDRVTDPDVLA